MALTLYGIPNCATVRRARDWLQQHSQPVSFHDFKTDGVPAARMRAWLATIGWERLVNRSGTTWRNLDAATREAVVDASSAANLMLAHPSVIRRPIVEWADAAITVGFDPEIWREYARLCK